MNQEIFEWVLLLVRWLHITVAVTWIGTSIFFMWLDRTLKPNPNSTKPGHVGELWMLHGGGFYHVEKLLMGPTKVPEHLHWFKWESYWTWLSGFTLILLIFYTGDGLFLIDSSVSTISYWQAVGLGLIALIGSWFFYDSLWELKITKNYPVVGHIFTILWLVVMSYVLCHTLSGRAAYMHIGGMIGTWMTANVFMRIIPRQLKMVEASKKGEPVNADWGKNAKNRSTHNTYFTLPVIFIMMSNHFPSTYGHEYNWLILLIMCLAGAAIREYFVVRLDRPARAIKSLIMGITLLIAVIAFSIGKQEAPIVQIEKPKAQEVITKPEVVIQETKSQAAIKGIINFDGIVPIGKKLNLPNGCVVKGDVYSNEVMVQNKKIENVLVRIIKGFEGKTFSDVPSNTIEIDQRNCQYKPRVVAVRVGQNVEFINSDSVFHNIKSVTVNNPSFNLPMPKKDQKISMSFKKPEIFLQSKCSVHPWMGVQIAVLDNPYFSLTNSLGEYKIENLPDGAYTIEIWHEVYGIQTKEVIIKDGIDQIINFTIKAK